MASVKAVVSVVGKDQKGVVARFATYVAEHGINIQDIHQQVTHGQFIMDMLVDLTDMTVGLDQLIPELLELGSKMEMTVRVTLRGGRRVKRMGLLVSREAHCLERFIKDQAGGRFGGRGAIAAVLSNHPDLADLSAQAGLPFEHHPSTDKAAHMAWMLGRLRALDIDVVVLARYMQILTPELVTAFRHRVINIHPSLLPYFPGAKPYHQAWESGVRVTGCTAHYVTEQLDQGPIILQDVFHIEVGKDTADDVRAKGQALEADVLSQAVQMHLDEKLVVVDDKVVFRPGLSTLLDHD